MFARYSIHGFCWFMDYILTGFPSAVFGRSGFNPWSGLLGKCFMETFNFQPQYFYLWHLFFHIVLYLKLKYKLCKEINNNKYAKMISRVVLLKKKRIFIWVIQYKLMPFELFEACRPFFLTIINGCVRLYLEFSQNGILERIINSFFFKFIFQAKGIFTFWQNISFFRHYLKVFIF